MGTVRIRWSGVGKIAIVAVAALLALQTVPALLRPPQPPPLGKDVGLPQVPPPAETPPKLRFESPPIEDKGTTQPHNGPTQRKPRSLSPDIQDKRTTGSGGRDVIGSGPRKPAPPAPVPYEPPPSLPPAPAVPPPPPAAPSDGSEEFAPR